MTGKTKCKLLFFSASNTKRDLSREPVCSNVFYDGICNFSHTYFSRITTNAMRRDAAIYRRLSRNQSCLSVGWLTIRVKHWANKPLKNLLLYASRHGEKLLKLFLDFSIICIFHISRYISQTRSVLSGSIESFKISSINDRFSDKIFITHHQLFKHVVRNTASKYLKNIFFTLRNWKRI